MIARHLRWPGEPSRIPWFEIARHVAGIWSAAFVVTWGWIVHSMTCWGKQPPPLGVTAYAKAAHAKATHATAVADHANAVADHAT